MIGSAADFDHFACEGYLKGEMVVVWLRVFVEGIKLPSVGNTGPSHVRIPANRFG